MRFVELRPDPARPGFALHPRITVLQGLTPADRVQIVGLVHSVAMGERGEWSGRVDVHGVRMGLDDALDLLGETAPAALVIDAGSLPVPGRPVGAGDVAAAQQALADAIASRTDLEAEVASIAAELASVDSLRAEMQARVASATARVDEGASDRLDEADGDLWEAARGADRPDPWTGMDDLDARKAQLEESLAALDHDLSNLHTGDRGTLAAATATARASLVTGEVHAPRAAALGEIWASLRQRLVGLQSRVEAAGFGTDRVAARLEAARTVLAAAEAVALPRDVTAQESSELTLLHDRVMELEAKASRGVRRGAARSALQAAQQDLTDALEPLGYPTWAAYRMGNGLASVSVEAIEEYDRALTEVEEAEQNWAELMTRLERETDLQQVLQAIDSVHREAVELIGSDPLARSDDHRLLSRALSDVVVDAQSAAIDPIDAVNHLRGLLDASGARGHGSLAAPAAVVALGDSWLDVLDAADAAATRLRRDRERAAEELAAITELGDGRRIDRLADLRLAVRQTEEEVAESREALLDRVAAQLELHALATAALSLAENHDEKMERLGTIRVLEAAAERRVPQPENGRRQGSIAERIPRGVGGPIPVVVAMGDADPRRLDELLGLPDDVQLLIVGDSPGIEQWAETAGAGLVGVVEPGMLV